MNLLDKFSAIEVKTDTRISAEDLRFCQLHQEAYDKARVSLLALAEQVEAARNEQTQILSPVTDKYLTDTYLTGHENMYANTFYSNLDETHNVLIRQISNYFKKTYQVSINEQRIQKALMPTEPKTYDRTEQEKYTQQLRCLTLRYEDIVDQIFVQVGGYSLQDKAIKELKEAARKAAWWENGSKKYEQKKGVIVFSQYAVHVDSFWSPPRINLRGDMTDVIRAVSYFENGTMGKIVPALEPLFGYYFTDWVFDCDLNKIKQVKCFKNGRMDIRFTTEAYAQQFVDEFLGREFLVSKCCA